MTKQEFINQVQAKAGLRTKALAESSVKATFDTLIEALASGENCGYPDFGIFKVVETKPRKCINPRTGAEMLVPAKKHVKFTQSKNLRLLLNPSA